MDLRLKRDVLLQATREDGSLEWAERYPGAVFDEELGIVVALLGEEGVEAWETNGTCKGILGTDLDVHQWAVSHARESKAAAREEGKLNGNQGTESSSTQGRQEQTFSTPWTSKG